MKATTFPQANKVLVAPPGHGDVFDLPVWSGDAGDGIPRVISCWKPDERERAALARGEPVWLWVQGSTHPPVALAVGSPFDTAAPEPDRPSDWDPTDRDLPPEPTEDALRAEDEALR